MAETIVSVVIEKLAQFIMKEAMLLGEVKDEVADISRTLESARAFLIDADKRQVRDEGVKTWVYQVREVTYEIEDVLDEFLFHMKQHHGPGMKAFTMKYSTVFLRQIWAKYRIVKEIQGIKGRLERIYERRSQFSLTASFNDEESLGRNGHLRLFRSLYLEEYEVVGIDKRKEELISLVLNEATKRKVISVVGMGGLGKTTLVRKVYEDVRMMKEFRCRAWITVSQPFSQEKLLKNLLGDLSNIEQGIANFSLVQTVNEIRKILEHQSYLIVLDDLWSTNAWDDLRVALPMNEQKSRVLITTRIHSVALHSSNIRELVYQLKPLSPSEAETLFCKKAFNGNPCPLELEEPTKKILDLCAGLPLAIVAIGGLLQAKKDTPLEWQGVLRNLTKVLQKSDEYSKINEILSLSYDSLHHHLKPCFLYFSMFSKDYVIDCDLLVQLWIDEGFVKQEIGMTMKQTAEGYLIELVNRSLIEVVARTYRGMIYECRMHDLLHDLVLIKSKEQNFITSLSDVNMDYAHIVQIQRIYRLSLHGNENLIVSNAMNLKKTRSLVYISDEGRNVKVPDLSQFKMLKVLYLANIRLSYFPLTILKLFHLRYLNLANTGIKDVPNSIGKLRNMQTLCLDGNKILKLPIGVLSCNNLRVLTFINRQGVNMPRKLAKLKFLQDLHGIELDGTEKQAQELGKLTRMRSLSIIISAERNMATLHKSISSMRGLEFLDLQINQQYSPLDINKFLSNLSPTLGNICVTGRLAISPPILDYLMNLHRIVFHCSKLQYDPLQAFCSLPHLAQLQLYDAYDGKKMSCDAYSFRNLEAIYSDGDALKLCGKDQKEWRGLRENSAHTPRHEQV